MNQYTTKTICPRCGGDGLVVYPTLDENGNIIEEESECQSCLGIGYFEWGKINNLNVDIDWIKNKIKKILKNLDIPEDDDE